MTEADFEKRINDLNTDLLNTVASLGEFVVAQNAALIEISRLVIEERKARGELASLQTLGSTLDAIKAQSHDYVKVLRASVTDLQRRVGDIKDA